jgi:glutamine cyclotransferase
LAAGRCRPLFFVTPVMIEYRRKFFSKRTLAWTLILGPSLLMLSAILFLHFLHSAIPVSNLFYPVIAKPHDSGAFTEGLAFNNGVLYESTGLAGRSTLRILDPETGEVRKQVRLRPELFGEGVTVLKGKIYQLTWKNHKILVYNEALELLSEIAYDGEAWGLTDNGRFLIISDGSDALRFVDPESFQTVKTVRVHDFFVPVSNLNELDYIRGEIYANVWPLDKIAVIDPVSGKVKEWIGLRGFYPPEKRVKMDAVLNGIAYDPKQNRIFITGKLWPRMFELHFKK